jgi:hypothetical protein
MNKRLGPIFLQFFLYQLVGAGLVVCVTYAVDKVARGC